MNHELIRKREGKGEGGSITPTCSCGWVGKPHYGYEDYQHSLVREQEMKHTRESREVPQ